MPIVWPEPTHGPGLIPYKTAADIIDWSIPCPSIFERKKPLVENTMRRIAKGIERYVINAAEPFIVTYYGPKKGEKFRGLGMHDPLATQTAANRFGLVIPHIQRQFGKSVGSGISEPVGTVMSNGLGKSALVTAFMAQHNGGFYDGSGRSMKSPISSITQTGSQQQVVTSHLMKYRGTCKDGQRADEPLPTVTAGGNHIAEVRSFLMKYYGTATGQSLNDPAATVTTRDRFGLITVMLKGEPYIITDIGMRMLSPRELFRAQGFDDSYKIDIEIKGARYKNKPNLISRTTKTDQVRLCGNSVCPPNAAALVKANANFLSKLSEVG